MIHEYRLWRLNFFTINPDKCIKLPRRIGSVRNESGGACDLRQIIGIRTMNLNTMPFTKEKHFNITSIHRDDLEQAVFDVSQIDDATMERLASKMADDYFEQLFWDQLPIIAEILGIPRKED